MSRRRGLWVVILGVVSVGAFAVVAVLTRLVGCGVSGCGGGGFGPAYAPVSAQVGLGLAGLTLAPIGLLVLAGRPWPLRAAGTIAVTLAGALLATVVSGLGPNGCPWGQTRAVAGPGSITPGAPTCSADRQAVPPG